MATTWFSARRDDYGRSVTPLADAATGRTLAMLVRLPRGYAEKYGDSYLLNDWTNPDRDAAVTYYKTRKAAKLAAEALFA
jgi:hypothetical protein